MNHGTILEEETLHKNRISKEAFSKGPIPTFVKAMDDFNDFIYNEFTKAHKSFCLVTNGDEVITRTLPKNAKK